MSDDRNEWDPFAPQGQEADHTEDTKGAEEAHTGPEEGGRDTAGDRGASIYYQPQDRYTPHSGGYGAYSGGSYTGGGYAAVSRRPRTALIICLAVALAAVMLFVGILVGGRVVQIGEDRSDTPGGSSNTPASPLNRGSLTIQVVDDGEEVPGNQTVPGVVEKVQNSVVEIRTTTTTTSVYYGDYVESGAGSGVLIASDQPGLILTCCHVIEGADANGITITLNTGETYSGSQVKVLGSDSWSDLALLQLDIEDYSHLTYAHISNRETLSAGETVVVIGNPLGELGGSVSTGCISALSRSVQIGGVKMNLMQTDASVNPGNSGGGMFDLNGRLIGIVNAKSTGEEIEGIGFAIPYKDAREIMAELYTQGYISGRPYLGLYFESSSSGLRIISYDYQDELTGGETVQQGDYLVSIDGTTVDSTDTIKAILGGKSIGDTVEVVLARYVSVGAGYMRRQQVTVHLTIHEYQPATAE